MEFSPLNPPELVPLTQLESAARQALKSFRRGANLGNDLEALFGKQE